MNPTRASPKICRLCSGSISTVPSQTLPTSLATIHSARPGDGARGTIAMIAITSDTSRKE
jgi:hypothetical protein